MSERTAINYRPDIDGLRAVAVLPVVLFHADLAAFSGGFVGVDVFFVISGYLITSLISDEIRGNRFSLAGFYERRARRILPALFAVILVCGAVAPIALSPDRFAEFGESVVATTLFSSNFLFWLQSGYFDAPADFKPLLHTWSLAVEEQFYILFPLFLMLIARFAGGRWLLVVIIVGAISLALSSWGAVYNPAAAFYLPQSRAWELALGSLLALRLFPPLRHGILSEIESIAGIALIAWGVFTFSDVTPFPGANAIFPCLGAAFLIHAGIEGSSLVNRVLSTRALVFVGLVSYSLYLWHWPAFVFARSVVPRELTAFETIAVIAFSFAAAILSWRFIERPFRGGSAVLSRPGLFSVAGGMAALLVAFGVFGAAAGGLRSGITAAALAKGDPFVQSFNYRTCFLEKDQDYAEWQAESCFINNGGEANALLWGDSFAAQYVPGLHTNRTAWSHSILQYTAAVCAPIFGWDPLVAPNCKAFNAHVFDVIERFNIKTVILAAEWNVALGFGLDPRRIAQTVENLRSRGLKVIVIGQSPVFRPNVEWLAARGKYVDGAPVEFDANINRQILRHSSADLFVDPLPFLCTGAICKFRTDKAALFGDSSHLTVFGSNWYVDRFVPLLNGIL